MNTLALSRTKDLFWILMTGLFIGLIALIKIPVPGSPVPVVFSVQAILFFSMWMGRKGAYATLAYLAYGAMGLPVFAGGSAGFIHFFGPTGGYLIGFAIAAFVVAAVSERIKEKTPAKAYGVMLLGNLIVYAFGVPFLALFVGMQNAMLMGFYTLIGGCMVKLLIATQLLKKLRVFQ